MRRRELVAGFCGATIVWPLAARTQQHAMARIGWLTLAQSPQIDSFRAGMRDLGYVEGRNLTIEQRDAEGHPERLAALASDLARQKVDAVVAVGGTAARGAREVTKTIPIVFMTNNSVDQGLVNSLARPGANLTGLELMSADISSKWLELIGELLPHATRFMALQFGSAEDSQTPPLLTASRSIGKQVSIGKVSDIVDLVRVLEGASLTDVQGMIVLSSSTLHANRKRIVEVAAQFRLPAIYEHRDFVEVGGLMSYGPDVNAMFRRLAIYVDRILKGKKPADLPVELPTKFELVINMKTAKALGITIPPSILARADEVIE